MKTSAQEPTHTQNTTFKRAPLRRHSFSLIIVSTAAAQDLHVAVHDGVLLQTHRCETSVLFIANSSACKARAALQRLRWRAKKLLSASNTKLDCDNAKLLIAPNTRLDCENAKLLSQRSSKKIFLLLLEQVLMSYCCSNMPTDDPVRILNVDFVRPSASLPRRHSTAKRTKTKDLDVQIDKPFVRFSIISFMWVKYPELKCINSQRSSTTKQHFSCTENPSFLHARDAS